MCINDCEGFINKTKNKALNKTKKKLSLNISDMYPLLPKDDMKLEVIRRIKEPLFKPNIKKGTLYQMIRLFVKFVSFKMNNKF